MGACWCCFWKNKTRTYTGYAGLLQVLKLYCVHCHTMLWLFNFLRVQQLLWAWLIGKCYRIFRDPSLLSPSVLLVLWELKHFFLPCDFIPQWQTHNNEMEEEERRQVVYVQCEFNMLPHCQGYPECNALRWQILYASSDQAILSPSR